MSFFIANYSNLTVFDGHISDTSHKI